MQKWLERFSDEYFTESYDESTYAMGKHSKMTPTKVRTLIEKPTKVKTKVVEGTVEKKTLAAATET